jgi:glycine hydroxymethyltransferase
LTTLGFGVDELDEVADVLVNALGATTPATSTAKAKYEIDPAVAQACRARCADLLVRHPLYPEIEL